MQKHILKALKEQKMAGKTHYITTYKEWERLSEIYNFNPSEVVEFSIDLGGGNSRDFEYTGDMPEKEEL